MTTSRRSGPVLVVPAELSAAPAAHAGFIRRVWRDHSLYLVCLAAYAAAGVALDVSGVTRALTSKVTYGHTYLLTPTLLWIPVLVTVIRERLRVREHGNRVNGWRGWALAFRSPELSRERFGGLLLLACVTPAFMNLFGGWKSAIPTLHPFAFDAALYRWDHLLHGGDPWRLLQPFLGRPAVTVWLDQAYEYWLVLLPAVIVWQAWSGDRRTRAQFFLAFAFTWILLGTVMATIWSSAGPCYYSLVTGDPNPYAPLLSYLRSVHEHYAPLLSQVGQVALWQHHLDVDNQPYTRISAFPSLHVAMPMLYALVGWRTHRLLGLGFAAYTAVVLIGSVHLGWHYAIDGEVALISVPLLWWGAGELTRRLGHG